jgi:hypothetical protein
MDGKNSTTAAQDKHRQEADSAGDDSTSVRAPGSEAGDDAVATEAPHEDERWESEGGNAQ